MLNSKRLGVCLRKRIFDLFIVFALIWLWLPVVVVSAFFNWICEGRPVFYMSRRRVHKDHLLFLIKFRTMIRDAVKIASRSTIPIVDKCFLNIPEDSELYTPIGRWLEKLHFTELPQFFQVALGQMTLVGNRPLPEDVCRALNSRYPHAPERFATLSGMVGPVQLVGRDFLTDGERLQIEIAYAQACLYAYNWKLDAMVLASMLMIALRILPSWTPQGVLSLLSLYSGLSVERLLAPTQSDSQGGDRREGQRLAAMPSTTVGRQQGKTIFPNQHGELANLPVVVLCGGKGTRAYPYTRYVPKALMHVHGRPIVEHIMDLFAVQGFNDFVLSLGHLKETVFDHFTEQRDLPLIGRIRMIDTGDSSDTGDRILNCRHLLGERFMATYADGICDVALDKLLEFHQSHDGLVTVTCVPLPSQYGTIEADEYGKVSRFREKPVLYNHWINAGFFVFDKAVFEHWEGHNLEQEVLPNLASKGLLYSYQHSGFFKSMDTQKDQQELEKLFAAGIVRPPQLLKVGDTHMHYSRDGGQ